MKHLRYFFVSYLLIYSASGFPPQTNENLLEQADYFADRYDWEKAVPLYANAERDFALVGHIAKSAYCRIAQIRASAKAQPLHRVYEALNRGIGRAPLDKDLPLRLRALFFKADLETEIDPI